MREGAPGGHWSLKCQGAAPCQHSQTGTGSVPQAIPPSVVGTCIQREGSQERNEGEPQVFTH